MNQRSGLSEVEFELYGLCQRDTVLRMSQIFVCRFNTTTARSM